MALSRTAKYYRKNKKARKKRLEYQREYNKSPKARKYRSELNKARRKRGIYGKGGGDLAHSKDGKSLRRQSPSKNRANNRPKVKQTSASDMRRRRKRKS